MPQRQDSVSTLGSRSSVSTMSTLEEGSNRSIMTLEMQANSLMEDGSSASITQSPSFDNASNGSSKLEYTPVVVAAAAAENEENAPAGIRRGNSFERNHFPTSLQVQ